MQEQVKLRREEIHGHALGEYKRKDAFSMLVQANESDENAKNKLTDRDLVSEGLPLLETPFLKSFPIPDRKRVRHVICRSRLVNRVQLSSHPGLIEFTETTAHTLAATLALLAVTPDAQEEVFQQIIDVVGWDRDPVSPLLVLLPSRRPQHIIFPGIR